MNIHTRALKRNREKAKQIASKKKENQKWILPPVWSMIQQGHGSLYRYIIRHPKKFEDFEFSKAIQKDGKQSFNITIR